MRGGTPDRVPVGPSGLGRLDPESDIARKLIKITDPVIPVWSGCDPFLGANIPVETEKSASELLTIMRYPGGELKRRERWTAKAHATVEFPFRSPGDAERYLAAPYECPVPDLTEYRRMRGKVGDEGLILAGVNNAVTLPASWFDPEGFCLTWAEDPGLVTRLVEAAAPRVNAQVEALCRAGVDAFRIVGGEYASVQLGPEAFRRLVVPFDRELVRIIHRHGGIAYYHNHGKMAPYYRDFVEIGMDALDPLEAPPWGDVADLGAARRAMKEKVCMVGNLDDMEVVDSLPVEEVARIAAERLRQAGPTGFVLGGTTSGTYTERAARAFIGMVEVVKSFR